MSKPEMTDLGPEHFNHEGINTFLRAYFDAPADADIEVRVAISDDDPPIRVIVVALSHPTMKKVVVGLSARQARAVGEIAENVMREFPGDPDVRGLPNLILSLRAGADKLEEQA